MIDLDLNTPPQDTRVVVAMSGGVDSSVVAALLKEAGYDVIGMTLQLYDHGQAMHRKGACCAGQDIQDARRVADRIGIPYYVLDYESRFSDQVIKDFADSYARGETPIPCVSCNQTVKFSDLLATAKSLGASALATGHYVQSHVVGNKRALFRPVDQKRDQSYFLFATTQDQLDYVRFPLGGMTKDEVRGHAERFGLDIAQKPDSQDICFVPQGRYTDIVKRLRPDAAEPGNIVHLDGRVLGQHDGIINYTIGQRRGIGIATGEPLYVIGLDAEDRIVRVGPREALETRSITLRDANWIGDEPMDAIPDGGVDVFARVRSTRPPIPARVFHDNGALRVELTRGEEGVAPGQACVFYDSDEVGARVFGGGFIASTDSAEKLTKQVA